MPKYCCVRDDFRFQFDQVHAHHDHHVASDFCLDGAIDHYAPDLDLEPQHMTLDLYFHIALHKVWGTVYITLLSRSPDASSVVLDAVDFDHVASVQLVVVDDDVSIDHSPPQAKQKTTEQTLRFHYDGDKIYIYLENPIPVGEKVTVAITYATTEPLDGLKFSSPTSHLPQAPYMVSSDHETERARYWLPCLDHPSVRTTLRFRIHTDAALDLIALANGTLVQNTKIDAQAQDQQSQGSNQQVSQWNVAEWLCEQRCPSYLLCVAIGQFTEADGGTHQGKPIKFYAARSFYSQQDLSRTFGKTVEMLDWMTDKLKQPLPWGKYYQFAASVGIGGAMENISLVAWHPLYVNDEIIQNERGWWVDLVNVHEMAHTYFGDSLVMKDFMHAWLKESWATFMEYVWLEDKYGVDWLHYMLHVEKDLYTAEVNSKYCRPIVTRTYDSSWNMFDLHLYPGGALRIFMLREWLGHDTFWKGVHLYLERFMDSIVETHDFRRALEDACGKSLERFFDQWFYGRGYPKLKASFSYDLQTKNAKVVLEQTQQDKAKGINLFDFVIEVHWEVEQGVWNSAPLTMSSKVPQANLVFSCDKKPLQVLINPFGKVLCDINYQCEKNMKLRSIGYGLTAYAKVEIARDVSKADTSSKAVATFQTALQSEPFWGCRKAFVDSLKAIGTLEALNVLCQHFTVEKDPRVLAAIASAIGSFRRPESVTALMKWLEKENSESYMTTCESLIGLGRQRRDENLDFLKKFLTDPDACPWWVWIPRAAAVALGESRSVAARDILREALYDVELESWLCVKTGLAGIITVQVAILGALASSLAWATYLERKETAEMMANIVKFNKYYEVRKAAGRALATLGDTPYARKTLEHLATRVSNFDAPLVRRLIKATCESRDKGDEFIKVVKDLDRQKEDWRNLKTTLEDLEEKMRNFRAQVKCEK